MADIIDYRALAPKVLAVAIKRIEGRNRETNETIYGWRVYVRDVPGKSHRDEVQDVASWGSVQSEKVAKALFPRITGMRYVQ